MIKNVLELIEKRGLLKFLLYMMNQLGLQLTDVVKFVRVIDGKIVEAEYGLLDPSDWAANMTGSLKEVYRLITVSFADALIDNMGGEMLR